MYHQNLKELKEVEKKLEKLAAKIKTRPPYDTLAELEEEGEECMRKFREIEKKNELILQEFKGDRK